MKSLLVKYYDFYPDFIEDGYFSYLDNHYFVMKCDSSFLEVFKLYEFMVHALNKNGYRIVRNKYNRIMSDCYMVFSYEDEYIDIDNYVYYTSMPLQTYYLQVSTIKERWIDKVDCVRKEVSKYSYSFQYDKDLNALIHYYCGMAETAISLLNEIIAINKKANLPLCLSLRHKIGNCSCEILNPGYYDISTRSRHFLNLFKSEIVSFDDLETIMKRCCITHIELMYMFARSLYCSEFFDYIMQGNIETNRNCIFLNNVKKEQRFIKELKERLIKFISLPEISWID